VEDNLIQEFGLADDAFLPNARQRLLAMLEQRQDEGRPVFVALKFATGLETAVSDLQQLLPAVTFVLLSGEDFPAAEIVQGRNLMLVEPRLAPGAEARAQVDFDYARSIVRPAQTGGH
jgi:hypothetical protein